MPFRSDGKDASCQVGVHDKKVSAFWADMTNPDGSAAYSNWVAWVAFGY